MMNDFFRSYDVYPLITGTSIAWYQYAKTSSTFVERCFINTFKVFVAHTWYHCFNNFQGLELPRCFGWEPFIVRQKWQRMYIQYRTDRINVEKNWCSWMVEATVCVVVLSLNRIAPISMIRNVYFNFNIFSIFENIG